MPKPTGLPFILGLLLFPNVAPAEQTSPPVERPPLVLGTGEQRLIRIEGLKRFSIGGPQIRALPLGPLRPSDSPKDTPILIKAVQPGTTDLWIWKSDGTTEHRRVRVEKTIFPSSPKPELLAGLTGLNEAEVIYAGESVVLRGELHTAAECARISALEKAFPSTLKNDTEIADSLLEKAEKQLLHWIGQSPWKDRLRLERRDRNLWLSGNLACSKDLAPIERRALTIFPALRVELQALPDDSPTVHFRVYLLELRKNKFGTFGVSWPPGQDAAFQITSSGIQDLLQLDLAIQAMEGDGTARVLSKPELVVRAPGEAELFSGGELPIQNKSQYFSNVTWRTFGLTLKLKVTHTTAEKVRLEIFTEVSHLDPTIAPEAKIPGLQANRMRTLVDARYGSPLLLSGLLQKGMRRVARGLPLLREIPVFGAIFGSQDWLEDKSELVAVLVPSVTPPRAPMERIIEVKGVKSDFPRGPVPPPRDWIDPETEMELRRSPDFPWNAFGEIREGNRS